MDFAEKTNPDGIVKSSNFTALIEIDEDSLIGEIKKILKSEKKIILFCLSFKGINICSRYLITEIVHLLVIINPLKKKQRRYY